MPFHSVANSNTFPARLFGQLVVRVMSYQTTAFDALLQEVAADHADQSSPQEPMSVASDSTP